jgi:hypothetical protein
MLEMYGEKIQKRRERHGGKIKIKENLTGMRTVQKY